jgi:uncharacterized membrane protein YkvI
MGATHVGFPSLWSTRRGLCEKSKPFPPQHILPGGGGALREQPLSPGQLAAVAAGGVVGAGFASGRELWDLFCLGFTLLTAAVLEVSRRASCANYRQLHLALVGPTLARALDPLVGASLYLGLAVSLAAGGALGKELWGIPPLGGIALAAAAAFPLAVSARRLAISSALLLPLLTVLLLGVTGPPHIPWTPEPSRPHLGPAALYLLYNGFLTTVLLASLGHRVSRPAHGLAAAVGAGALVGILMLAGVEAVRARPQLALSPLPLLHLALERHPLLGGAYALALAAAVVTSAVGNAYALAARLGPSPGFGTALGVVAASLPLAFLGFVPLVRYGYRVVALLGALDLTLLGAGILFGPGRRHRVHRGAR